MRWTVKRSRPRHEPWGLKKLKDSAIQTRIYENWVSRYFVISLNFTPPLRLFTVLFAYVAFLGGCFVIMGLRRSGWRQNLQIRALSNPPPTPPPNVQGIFPSQTRILCLTSNSWCRLAVYIWDGTKLIRFAKSASSMANIVLYSRSLQRQKGTILFALLGWPPCLWPWKQDSSSPGQDLLWKHGLSWFADRVSVHSGAWIE